ncbi:MAG: hypothetical protein B7Z55_11595, partial [Planctomycetales bacterium 12-60-4]
PLPNSLRRKWSGEAEVEDAPAAPQKFGKPKKSNKKPADSQGPKSAAVIDAGPDMGDRFREWGGRLRATVTPVRLVAVGIALGLALTFGVIVRKAQWSGALATLQGALDRATAAVQERDFATAAKEYRVAASALDVLGRRDAAAQRIRHSALETNVAAGWNPSPWSVVLSNSVAHQDGKSSLPSEDASWIMFDVLLFPEIGVEEDARRQFQIDLPLMIDNTPVDIVIDGRKWAPLLSGATAEKPKRVIFAAQIESCERSPQGGNATQLQLDGVTAVLWSDEALYTALGLMPKEESAREPVQLVLQSQSDFLESQP